jgi:hypothetical protein
VNKESPSGASDGGRLRPRPLLRCRPGVPPGRVPHQNSCGNSASWVQDATAPFITEENRRVWSRLGSHGAPRPAGHRPGAPPAQCGDHGRVGGWCTTATPVAVRTSGMWGGEPCLPRGISMVRCSTPLARWRRQEYQRKQQQPSVAGLSAFLGRFLPKLGGASRCRPFFACAGGTRHGRLCHVSAGPATYVILRHGGRPFVFRLCGILPCRPWGVRLPAGGAQGSTSGVIMLSPAGTRCGLGTGRSSCGCVTYRLYRSGLARAEARCEWARAGRGPRPPAAFERCRCEAAMAEQKKAGEAVPSPASPRATDSRIAGITAHGGFYGSTFILIWL